MSEQKAPAARTKMAGGHLRVRPFNTKDTYPEQNLDNDLCQAVVAGNTVYLRGQIGQDLETRESVGVGDVAAQTEQAMANIAMLLEEGLPNVFARHARYGQAVRNAVKAWGLELCARDPVTYSNTVSAIVVPKDKNANDVVKNAYARYNLSLGGGLGEVAGKVFRIGHMGDLNEVMILGALAGAEMALRDSGIEVVPGSGVGAASEYLRTTANAR